MKNTFVKLSIISLFTIGTITAVQAQNKQVVNSVHVGGSDICEGIGEKPGCDANLSLMAITLTNGKVIGQYSDRFANGEGFHAVVDCLSVNGNDAWIAGVIKSGTFGGEDISGDGLRVITRVQDNGNSQQDDPDKI